MVIENLILSFMISVIIWIITDILLPFGKAIKERNLKCG